MNASLKTLIVVALAALAAGVSIKARATDNTLYVPVAERIAQCERNAGAMNPDEKAACIQVAKEDAAAVVTFPVSASTNLVAACSINAGSANSVEREACIQVYSDSDVAKAK